MEKPCKKCRSIVQNAYVKCTICDVVYHKSCFAIAQRANNCTTISENEMICEQHENEKTPELRRNKRQRIENDDEEDYPEDIDMLKNIFSMVKNLTNSVNEMKSQLEEITTENKALRTELAAIKDLKTNVNNSNHRTYASATNTGVLVIKPLEKTTNVNESADKLRDDLKKNVKPGEMHTNIQIGKTTKDGGVILKCHTKNDVTTVQRIINEKMGQTYQVNQPKLRRNRVKIVGIDKEEHDASEEEFLTMVKNKNNLKTETTDMKVLHRTKINKNRFNVILETNEYVFNEFMSKVQIFVGWSFCRVFEDLGIIRCYNCSRYGHMAGKCPNNQTPTCPICSGSHKWSECNEKNPKKCINCSSANERLKLKLETNHSVFDKECPSLQKIIHVQRRKVGENNNA